MHFLLQVAPTTQQAIQTAVDAKADQWYAPLVGALVLAGVALIAALGGLALAWVNTAKAKLLAAEATAQAVAAKALNDVNSQRITNVSAHVARVDGQQTELARDVGRVVGQITGTGNGGPLPGGIVGGNLTDRPKGT